MYNSQEMKESKVIFVHRQYMHDYLGAFLALYPNAGAIQIMYKWRDNPMKNRYTKKTVSDNKEKNKIK